MRETVVLIAIVLILMLAAFQSGYILGCHGAQEIKKMVYQNDKEIRDLKGQIIALKKPSVVPKKLPPKKK